jgi:hypothetical protein
MSGTLPPLSFASCTGQPLPFKSEYAIERGSGKLVSPYQTTRRHNPEDGNMTTDWYVCSCRHSWRFYSGTPYAVSVGEVHLALHCDIARCRARCITGPALRCSSFLTLIEYCNSLQMHTIRIALQQRYMEHCLQAEFCRQPFDMNRFST